ncbi:MAG: glycoside hydrolase family 30 beta sandwich domain-containing protein [Edaphobacter sp.]|uniref:glycoside hydrolase family 30 protein n=1 Tax=Edaphobacter sp. TaxID=1934404 RepID=UPI002394D77C|nr:glycoside hydrolase family 30 beta sandwich domain-containing protein [Edaphobacter sp.]MDE1175326.1 glycoside hydrolase family 30 beta sandwich domain-containing protein [Edaphobacter sp.]
MMTIAIDDHQRFQTMEGFGGSITDGTAWLLDKQVSPATRNKVMSALFDPHRGIGLSFLRQPFGSTDLSRSESTYDDVPAGSEDRNLEHFSIEHDRESILPITRQAIALNPKITVMASPWSAPAWMKTKGSLDGGQLRDEALPFYANYLTRAIQAYQKAGVPIRYLTVQNEPLYETKNYPGTFLPATQAAVLIGKYLGPELKHDGLKTAILAYDHNWDHPEYPLSLLSDASVSPYLAGSALHCYGGEVTAQEKIHQEFPEKGIWLTECSGGTWDREPALIKTSHLLIESTRNWAKAVSLWGLVLDSDHGPHSGGCGTCRALVTLDLHVSPAEVTYTGDFYALGHASKFVQPGAVRIASNSYGDKSLETVAYQNPDRTIVLIALNNLAQNTSFRVTWAGRTFTTSLKPSTLATYIWQPTP